MYLVLHNALKFIESEVIVSFETIMEGKNCKQDKGIRLG